jgi:hypothetical protein
MTEQEIVELAAILINEHGHAALETAERRCDQHAHEPGGEAFRLWTRIAEAVGQLLLVPARREAQR